MYSIAELRGISVPEYRAVPTGKTYLNRFGKTCQELAGKEYLKTSVGKFELSEWYDLMRDAVKKEGKEELLTLIKEHVTTHCVWLRTDRAREEYALDCLSSGAYLAWDGFQTGKEPKCR